MVVLGNTGVATMVVEDENCTYENIHIETVVFKWKNTWKPNSSHGRY